MLGIVVFVATMFLGVYSAMGIVFGSLYNLSPKFRRYVDTLMGYLWEEV